MIRESLFLNFLEIKRDHERSLKEKVKMEHLRVNQMIELIILFDQILIYHFIVTYFIYSFTVLIFVSFFIKKKSVH